MYPVNTVGSGFTFTNVDLRHQIYTDVVNRARFNDGDQNTAVIDTDGSLAGLVTIDKYGPRSHEGLPHLAQQSAVQRGVQLRGRVPVGRRAEHGVRGTADGADVPRQRRFAGVRGAVPATQPGPRHDQILRFSKDSLDFVGTKYQEHADMELHGRDGPVSGSRR